MGKNKQTKKTHNPAIVLLWCGGKKYCLVFLGQSSGTMTALSCPLGHIKYLLLESLQIRVLLLLILGPLSTSQGHKQNVWNIRWFSGRCWPRWRRTVLPPPPCAMHHPICKDQPGKESTLAHSVKAKTLYVSNNPETNAIQWAAISALFILGKYFQRKPSYAGPWKAFYKRILIICWKLKVSWATVLLDTIPADHLTDPLF